MGNTQTVYLPPWEPTTDEERARAEEYTQAVRSISTVRLRARSPAPSHQGERVLTCPIRRLRRAGTATFC